MTTHEVMLQAIYASRGRILQMTIDMETMIDIYISEYFAADEEKQRELTILIVSPKVNLAGKVEILSYLLKKDVRNSDKDIKILADNITKIISERNIFAHWPVDFSESATKAYEKDVVISYVKLKQSNHEGSKVLGMNYHYKEENINAVIGLIQQVNQVLKWLTDRESLNKVTS